MPLNLAHVSDGEEVLELLNPDRDACVRSRLMRSAQQVHHTETLSVPVGMWSGAGGEPFRARDREGKDELGVRAHL